MKVNKKPDKRSIDFNDIREGTAFTKGNVTYFKGSGGAAMDVETGKTVWPSQDPDGGWEECYIYPRASLSLE